LVQEEPFRVPKRSRRVLRGQEAFSNIEREKRKAILIQKVDSSVFAQNDSGGIRVTDSSRVTSKTGSGRIEISDATGEIRATTHSGSIVIRKANGSLFARNNSGSIEVAEIAGAIDVQTAPARFGYRKRNQIPYTPEPIRGSFESNWLLVRDTRFLLNPIAARFQFRR
jgi:DUF4097 and DUF4098 domain-containing protein YvlB